MSHEKTKKIIYNARKTRNDFKRGTFEEQQRFKDNYDAIFGKKTLKDLRKKCVMFIEVLFNLGMIMTGFKLCIRLNSAPIVSNVPNNEL